MKKETVRQNGSEISNLSNGWVMAGILGQYYKTFITDCSAPPKVLAFRDDKGLYVLVEEIKKDFCGEDESLFKLTINSLDKAGKKVWREFEFEVASYEHLAIAMSVSLYSDDDQKLWESAGEFSENSYIAINQSDTKYIEVFNYNSVTGAEKGYYIKLD